MHRKNGLPCALVAWLAFGHIVRPARGSSAGAGALQWLLGEGMPLDTFFEQYWERRPLHIRRKNDKYYEGALAFSQDWFLGCVDKGDIQHGKHVFWSSYSEGKRRSRRMVGVK
jgi:hypothetical protein